MRRLSVLALVLCVAVGCGDEPVRQTADATTVRGARLFEPEPEPAPVVPPDATDPATAQEEAAPPPAAVEPDAAIGDPSAPLSEPPPPIEEPAPEPPEAATPDETAPEDAPQEGPDETADAAADDDASPAHSGVDGSGDEPVKLEFPEPDENGVIKVTFEQLASFEYVPPDAPKEFGVVREDGAAPTTPDGKVVDPTQTDPMADALRKGGSTIPEPIRKLSGKKIQVEGYMIPLRFEDGKVKSFFLSRHLQGCCFGIVPRVNDVIEVEMVAEGDAFYDAYMPILVTGPFEVREGEGDPAYMQTIYYMKGEKTRFSEDW